VNISGIRGSLGADNVYRSPVAHSLAQQHDRYMSALRGINPGLAEKFHAQVHDLRSSGATEVQVGQAMRNLFEGLSASGQADVRHALQQVNGNAGTPGPNGFDAGAGRGGAPQIDRYLGALRSVDPGLADELRSQVHDLRSSGATDHQVADALRQTVGQLGPSEQDEVRQAIERANGHEHARRGAGPTGTDPRLDVQA